MAIHRRANDGVLNATDIDAAQSLIDGAFNSWHHTYTEAGGLSLGKLRRPFRNQLLLGAELCQPLDLRAQVCP